MKRQKKTFANEIAFYHILKLLESLVKPMFILNCTMFFTTLFADVVILQQTIYNFLS